MSTVREQKWDSWSNPREAVIALKDNKYKPHVYIVATGAGAGLQNIIWQIPGISTLLAGCSFPYSTNEVDNLIGFKPQNYCSLETTIEQAMAAYIKARQSLLTNKQEGKPIGLAINAVVATTKEHRGEHRIFVSTISPDGGISAMIYIPKHTGLETRIQDGYIADICGLNILLYTMGMAQIPISSVNVSGNVYAKEDQFLLEPKENIPSLLKEQFFKHPVFGRSGCRYNYDSRSVQDNTIFMTGTFNPIHWGHRTMAEEVEFQTKKRVIYTICVDSLHKEALSVPQMLDQAASLLLEKWNGIPRTILFTKDDPLFLDKARKFPSSTYVVGADTLMRMLDPAWGLEIRPMLTEMRRLNTKFLVFGRHIKRTQETGILPLTWFVYREIDTQGYTWMTADEAIAFIPEEFKIMFMPMIGKWGPISSTAIREASLPNGSKEI